MGIVYYKTSSAKVHPLSRLTSRKLLTRRNIKILKDLGLRVKKQWI